MGMFEAYVKRGKANLMKIGMSDAVQSNIAKYIDVFTRFVHVHADIAADAHTRL